LSVLRKHWRSPNFNSRDGAAVSLLVLHYTGMRTADDALARLCEAETKVSAHYLVEENGIVHPLVDEKDCAWHAGVSFWRGQRNVNPISIGIEVVNPGHEFGYRAVPEIQMKAVAALSMEIIQRHKIAPRDVVGHSDIAPQRKEDPGELFNWQWLARQGVGLWPGKRGRGVEKGRALKAGDEGEDVLKMQSFLAEYGYEVAHDGRFDEPTQKVVVAFQRHFRPSDIRGVWDEACEAALAGLLAIR
jgi:N-acetylmuramoyl-L-alanine amidase